MPKKLGLEVISIYNVAGIAEAYFELIGKPVNGRQAARKAFIQLTNKQINKEALIKVLRMAYLEQYRHINKLE